MMTTLKTWSLASIAVFLLFVNPTVTEVVEPMSDCKGFFLDESTPNIPGVLKDGIIQDQNRYKTICQTYENVRRFVTLYDTENKIPVFSAAKFIGTDGGKRPNNVPWKTEPQLEDTSNMWVDVPYKNQASDTDYKNNQKYDRGHLFPSSYGYDNNEKISTFTLTNVVPQLASFNQGSWSNMETCVKCVMESYCKNNNGITEGFVITGAKPGTEKLNNKINIPSMLWTAFCCYSNELDRWLASAHWGSNTAEHPKHLETRTLEQLQQELGIEAFPNKNCHKKNVAEFYPEINNANKNCSCPPQDPTTSAPPTTTAGVPSTPHHQQFQFPSERMRLICDRVRKLSVSRREAFRKLMIKCSKLRKKEMLEIRDLDMPSTNLQFKIDKKIGFIMD